MMSLFGLSTAALASPPAGIVGGEWTEFFGNRAAASFAWAGEDEGCWHASGRTRFCLNDASDRLAGGLAGEPDAADLRLMTGLAAPEPPSWVLAGLAFGVVIGGRSLLGGRAGADSESAA